MKAVLSEATVQVMAARRAKPKGRVDYPCEGVCGGMLRPWRRTATEFPGTKMEYSERRCIGCWIQLMRSLEPENPAYALTPCTSPDCTNITRPKKEPLAGVPGTVTRVDGGQCATCSSPSKSKPSTEHTVRGLEQFMSTMRANANKVRNRGWN